MPQQAPMTEAELRPILEPEFNHGTFKFGKNPDGTARTWKMLPLPWKYEKHFRRQVMPMLAATYKPFETAMSLLSKNSLNTFNPHLTRAMFDAEVEVDEFLSAAMVPILLAQEPNPTITAEWVDNNADSREQLFSIIQQQCDLHKIMDRLGESLAERFAKLAQMMGVDVDLPSLNRLWRQVSVQLSAQITKLVSTGGNAIGLSSVNSNGTMLNQPIPKDNGPEDNGDSLLSTPVVS